MYNQRRQPSARSFPAPCRALLWRHARHPVAGEIPNAEEKTRQRVIDALNEAAACPGADRRAPVCSPAS